MVNIQSKKLICKKIKNLFCQPSKPIYGGDNLRDGSVTTLREPSGKIDLNLKSHFHFCK